MLNNRPSSRETSRGAPRLWGKLAGAAAVVASGMLLPVMSAGSALAASGPTGLSITLPASSTTLRAGHPTDITAAFVGNGQLNNLVITFTSSDGTFSGTGTCTTTNSASPSPCTVTFTPNPGVTTACVTATGSGFTNEVCYTVRDTTPAHVRSVIAHRSGNTVTFRWHMAINTGVAGFNLYAGKTRLNSHVIAHHTGRNYSATAHTNHSGPYKLGVILSGGKVVMVKATQH